MVSHTPVETETLDRVPKAGNWTDLVRQHTPEPKSSHLVELSRPDWKNANRGRRLDHIWVSPPLGDCVSRLDIAKAARGWERPSDHVPATAAIET